MRARTNGDIQIAREVMSEAERKLFLRDITRVTDEYFEREGDAGLNITATRGGCSVCILITARCVKKMRTPQQ